MAFLKQREIFLSTCLLESIEDENYRNTRKLLIEHKANPNLLIPESNIAPIHYAAGMENTSFAETAMKLILKHNGNPNVQTIEGETPLHIAVIWNRSLIVEMLLDHGADLSIIDNDNNTPINHAITEKHYNLIPIFQNYVFEEKLQKKIESKKTRCEKTPSKAFDAVVTSFQQLEITKTLNNDKVLTPNRTNFNFKEASPFLVNINCRRPKHTQVVQSERIEHKSNVDEDVIVISDSEESCGNDDNKPYKVVKNLFELTEENIVTHLSMITTKKRKDSLINLWRNKVNRTRHSKSVMSKHEIEFEALLSEHTEASESPSIESSHQSVDTVVRKSRPKSYQQDSESEDSFFTASSPNKAGEMILIPTAEGNNDLMNTPETIVQTQEIYKYFDVENDIVFYENRLLANPKTISLATHIHNEAIILNTSSESGTCTDLLIPSDYDTDDLRKELRDDFGDAPGPINKSTKRLYLKRLYRYKRRPPQTSEQKQGLKCNFSIELQKTMKKDLTSIDFINEYGVLERQMINSFQSNTSKNMREGNLKKSFIYLLIDPRVSENLLAQSQIITQQELWCQFLRSIFYAGKGKSGRPYAHLYDAIKIYNGNSPQNDVTKYQESVKLDRIIDIWRANKGVICLQFFHHITPAEAYTREAAIIDCLGVENLANIKRGDYYGIAKSWTMRDRKKLGVLLLYKAMQVFMVEGESQLRPNDIK